MPASRTQVSLTRKATRRENIFAALDRVRDDLIPKLHDQVMLKPNFLSNTNQLASTHPDAVRGANWRGE